LKFKPRGEKLEILVLGITKMVEVIICKMQQTEAICFS